MKYLNGLFLSSVFFLFSCFYSCNQRSQKLDTSKESISTNVEVLHKERVDSNNKKKGKDRKRIISQKALNSFKNWINNLDHDDY